MKSATQSQAESSSSSELPGDRSSCPICLGPINEDAYLDICFHRYCYNCILRWARVAAGKASTSPATSVKCPLCKTDNFSIIYGYTQSASGPHHFTFQRHYINAGHSTFFTRDHKSRWQCYSIEPGSFSDLFNVTRYWRSGKYLHPNRWIQSWLGRELQALLQEEDVDVIVHHIHGVIDSFCRSNKRKFQREVPDIEREEFRAVVLDAAMPFLGARTERFVMEVELFLASGLTIDAYDKAYKKKLGWNYTDEEGNANGNSEGGQRIGILSNGSEQQQVTANPLPPYSYLFEDLDDQEAD